MVKNNEKEGYIYNRLPCIWKNNVSKNYILNEYKNVNSSCVNINTDDIRMMLYQKAYEAKGEALAWDVFNRIFEEFTFR